MRDGFWEGVWMTIVGLAVTAVFILLITGTMARTDAAMECAIEGKVAVKVADGSFWQSYICIEETP